MELESKLIPIMREGVEVIKMIFFKKLKDILQKKYHERDTAFVSRLAGAMVNTFFGIHNPQEPFATFLKENEMLILEEMKNISGYLEEMCIPLTDALRVQFLCDSMEGVESEAVLTQAAELGMLIVDREVPLPKNFLALVRQLGKAFQLLVPAEPSVD